MAKATNTVPLADDALGLLDDEPQAGGGPGEDAVPWVILVADDDDEVHLVTRLVLRDFVFEGRPALIIGAHTGEATKDLVAAHPEAAVLLLDVVMESDNIGLDVVRHIREELGNNRLRIVLRTGQPGQAPEKSVVIDYDINDYKDKTELTAQKLTTTVVAALRAYRDIETIENSRRGLEQVMAAARTLFEPRTLDQFANAVLAELLSLLDLGNRDPFARATGFAASRAHPLEPFTVLAAAGRHRESLGQALAPELLPALPVASERRHHVETGPRDFLGYFPTDDGAETVVVVEGSQPLSETAAHLARVYSASAAVAFDNIRLAKRLERDATHDALTGLGNRLLLGDRLSSAMAQVQRSSHLLAVLFLDLDNFKYVNNSLGHAAGDLMLQEVARRIGAAIRGGDTAARVGGDEFVILLFAPEGEEAIAQVVRRLHADIAQPMTIMGETVVINCSIGIALYPRDGDTAEGLIRSADVAMYGAKEMGRSTFRFFTPEINERMAERIVMEQEMRHAVERGELVLHYQPLVSLATDRIIGAEALVRWNHPRLGMVPPGRFIPIAEDSGQILDIGDWVMAQAGRDALGWAGQGLLESFRLCLNLSPRQFQKPELVSDIERVLAPLAKAGIDLELEVTEGMVMGNATEAAAIMDRLKEIGVNLSMDDFGTGYSSLAYLRVFPFDTIKVDRSFVDGIGKDQGSEAIIRTIMALAESFGLSLIAEGMETSAQMDYLRGESCLVAQGFLLGRPMPEPEFAEQLRRRGRKAASR